MEPISFLPLTSDDFPMLHERLKRPHVAEWWDSPNSFEEVRDHFTAHAMAESTTRGYIALLSGVPVGFFQSYVVLGSGDGWWEDETDPGARGIDQFLANADQLGTGLGTRLICAFTDYLFEDAAVTRVQVDPSPLNARAIRSYEKAGFVRSREVDTPDGRALLMLRERPR
ncbi:MAG: GNAT family N-acetyltransferase [Burkholderiaceae bacterium]